MKCHSDPILSQQHDSAIEEIEGHPHHKGPLMQLSGKIPAHQKESEDKNVDDITDHASLRRLKGIGDFCYAKPEHKMEFTAADCHGAVLTSESPAIQ